MPEIRALIVDDEPLARRGVRQLLADYPDVIVVGECRDGTEALRTLGALKPDLVFLDIEMPGLHGFDLIEIIGAQRMPVLVFVTAHESFAVRAFEVRALDYLVKPLSAARFRAVMERVYARMRLSRPGGRIAVPTAAGERFLEPHEIDRIEADNYHARIDAAGTRYRVRMSLSDLEARLDPARFVRIHRSIIVRVDDVRELREDSNGVTVVLRDGRELPVSRRRLARVREALERA
jgi:two-component system LytT family response regulator